jgi:uncharacterized protein with HEPN domain
VTDAPEIALLAALVAASDSVAVGLREAIELMGPPPQSIADFAELGLIERTAAAALLKRVEQQQDIIARLFRTALIADGVDISGLTARDVANHMEGLGVLADANQWSTLVRLRNRLVHEYPVDATEQFDRVTKAIAAEPVLEKIRGDLVAFLRRQNLLAKV